MPRKKKEEGIADEIKEKIEEGGKALEKLGKKVEKVIEKEVEVLKKKIGKKGGKKERKNLEKEAKSESANPDEIERKRKELLAKAEKLKEKIELPETEKLKEQIKEKKKTDMLIPLEDYVKSGIYIGTKVVTPKMKPFVYRRRADGLAIFNTDLIDEKIKDAIEFLSKFDAKDVIAVCKRECGWNAVEKFSELTGIRAFTKKYPAGVLTNTTLPDFFENELTILVDSWVDKNALNDTLNVKKKVLMICDTNNFSKGADCIIIGNNKSARSLGVIFYLLTRGYLKAKGKDISAVPDLEWWTQEG